MGDQKKPYQYESLRTSDPVLYCGRQKFVWKLAGGWGGGWWDRNWCSFSHKQSVSLLICLFKLEAKVIWGVKVFFFSWAFAHIIIVIVLPCWPSVCLSKYPSTYVWLCLSQDLQQLSDTDTEVPDSQETLHVDLSGCLLSSSSFWFFFFICLFLFFL